MGVGTDHVNNLQLGLPGQLPRKWERRLVSASVEDSSNLAAVAELRFRDEHGVFYSENGIAIGTKVTLRVRRGRTASVLLFKGEVVTLESQHDGHGTFSVIRALDLSHRLMRGQRVRSFVKQTPSVIAKRLAGAAGLPIGKIDSFTRSYEMITQPNVSDWEFLKMLAVDNEAEVAVIDGKFYFRTSERASTAPGTGLTAEQSPKVIEAGNNVLAVRSTVTSVGQVPNVTVRGWDPARKRSIKTELQVTDSTELDIKTTPRKAIQPFGSGGAGLNVTDVPYETEAETRVVARAVAADVTAALAEVEVGVRGRPELRAGVPMTLKKIGPEFDGKYTITASRHVFAPGSVYETWVTVSGRQDRSVFGLAGGAGAPARPVRVPGLAIGIVTDTKADARRRNQGLVRLRFPWLTDDTEYQTDWVRTVQLGGVAGGGVVSPDINDEVLVGFEQGLLDRPYVIGGLYNGKDSPSPHQSDLIDGTTGKVNRRSFASRAGDRMELLDSRLNPQGIRLATAKDKLVVFLDRGNKKIVVHADGKIEIDATGSIEVRGNGITLDAGRGDLTLKGRRVEVAGALEADIHAPIVKLN
ncbi:VgrG-related protein [Actinoplanes sp. L3-i22]|uniref:VgrG-related protein n=1 Tax=Actinoplanes sp. L3-i22 TaxID=2836373 RepID=UPI001C780050|nr:VgrG-related protein [Actinoplanes sp. L3-i22]BCY05783.1 type IV secretion protein Rhs [Actinoplanes sp. L3-i22]